MPSALAPAFDFSVFEFLLERVVPRRKRSDRVRRRCLRAPQQHLLLVQRPPLRRSVNQSAFFRRRRPPQPSAASVALRRSLVLFDHRLDAILRIAARANQILLRVIDFILIQFLLRVRDVELIFQRIFLISGGLRDRCVELRDLRLLAVRPCSAFCRRA